VAALVGHDLGVGEPGGVVDADVDELPAGCAQSLRADLLLAAPVADDAMAGAEDAAQLLDVEVQQPAGPGVLVAVGRLGQVESAELAQLGRRSTADTVESAIDKSSAISGAVIPNRRSATIASTRSAGVRCSTRFGADERSSRPASPSARHLASHFAAVRPLTPAARGASASDHPASTLATINRLLFGQVLALACNFIPCPPWDRWR
jgi:hypothetical protein